VKTRGGQVFYRKGNERGERLATAVQKRVNDLYVGVGGRARTMATGDFFMLTCVDCPSILIECGFLSNGEDERLLQTESWQKQLAECICAGVLEYFEEFSV
jgi:N-acetylmuramoyl-L-alanine amidase